MELKAKIVNWGLAGYSVDITLPHKSFNMDSNNYKTIKQAKRSAQSLAARMEWKLKWNKLK